MKHRYERDTLIGYLLHMPLPGLRIEPIVQVPVLNWESNLRHLDPQTDTLTTNHTVQDTLGF